MSNYLDIWIQKKLEGRQYTSTLIPFTNGNKRKVWTCTSDEVHVQSLWYCFHSIGYSLKIISIHTSILETNIYLCSSLAPLNLQYSIQELDLKSFYFLEALLPVFELIHVFIYRGVAVDDQGYIFVADSGNNRIQIFNPDGTFLRSFGRWGAGAGEFKGLEGIAVNANGNILVADRENHRVQMFWFKEGLGW